jgi:hypothetical protein
MPRSSERGAVRRRSSFSIIRARMGCAKRGQLPVSGHRAGVRRVTPRNRGEGAAPGRTTHSVRIPALSAIYIPNPAIS